MGLEESRGMENDRQLEITSYESLVHVLGLKMESGRKDVELLVAPRFTMLSGG